LLRSQSLEGSVSPALHAVCISDLHSYALNFKGVQYRTEWIDLSDVATVRQKLGAAPNRKFPDGSDFYTLPIIQDVSNNEIIGDSFDIAVYLDRTYPDDRILIPRGTEGLHKAFNIQADAVFTAFVILLVHGMPLNPETAHKTHATFAQRAGVRSWDDFAVRGEERVLKLVSFKAALEEFAKIYRRRDMGPFLEGDTPMYADLIVGAWLQFVKRTLPAEEWSQIQAWQDGLWGALDKALEQYAQVR